MHWTARSSIFTIAKPFVAGVRVVEFGPKEREDSITNTATAECKMAVQGHPRSLISVPIESVYATSC